MRRLAVSLFLALGLCLGPTVNAQQKDQDNGTQKQVDKCFSDLAARRLKDLSDCDAKVQQWESWANTIGPNNDHVRQDNDELTAENSRLNKKLEAQSWVVMQWLFWIAAGLGAGALAMYAIVKSIKWSWPQSAPGKQLFVLISGATWITAAALLALLNDRLSDHPINMLATVCVYSLPAVLFGGVCFWWIGKNQPSQKTA
jgi:hypothetical protein